MLPDKIMNVGLSGHFVQQRDKCSKSFKGTGPG